MGQEQSSQSSTETNEPIKPFTKKPFQVDFDTNPKTCVSNLKKINNDIQSTIADVTKVCNTEGCMELDCTEESFICSDNVQEKPFSNLTSVHMADTMIGSTFSQQDIKKNVVKAVDSLSFGLPSLTSLVAPALIGEKFSCDCTTGMDKIESSPNIPENKCGFKQFVSPGFKCYTDLSCKDTVQDYVNICKSDIDSVDCKSFMYQNPNSSVVDDIKYGYCIANPDDSRCLCLSTFDTSMRSTNQAVEQVRKTGAPLSCFIPACSFGEQFMTSDIENKKCPTSITTQECSIVLDHTNVTAGKDLHVSCENSS
jgi:hypothetical protein